jgi:Tfp pilus assembly PilM family ATPase
MGGDRITDLLEQSLGVERSMAEIMKMDMSRIPGSEIKSDMFDRVIDPIVKEIQYGFDVFLRQNQEGGKTPEKIILTGGSSVIPFFSTRLSEVFNMKVFVGDPWARVVYQDSLKPVLDSIGPRMAVSIGLALRNILKG